MSAFIPEAFADRLRFAIGQALTRHRFENQGELASRLSSLSGISITQPAVSRWMTGSRPALEHLVALAELATVDPGWLAVGMLSKAPEPDAYLPLREVAPIESPAAEEPVPTAPVAGVQSYDEERAAKKKTATKRRARGGG